jgi:hypothetical protein
MFKLTPLALVILTSLNGPAMAGSNSCHTDPERK